MKRGELPLDGIRVVELCWVWSGPMMGQQLADLGAEVVKIEWYDRFDLYRTRGVERLRGKIPERVRRESSFSFQSLNRNKLGFAADLKSEQGIGLVKDLIRESDIVLENFTVGTLERLGLGAQIIREINPAIVLISLSATGRGSSIEGLRGYGLMLSALGGYEDEVRDDQHQFVGSPTFVMSDPNAALFGVFAALAGVLHAKRTGVGAHFECSQVEAVATLMDAPSISEHADTTIEGIYPAADGTFVAVTLYEPVDSVATNHNELEAWVANRSGHDAVTELEARGGCAAQVHSLGETGAGTVFAGAEVRQATLHPMSGKRDLIAAPWQVDGRRPAIRKPAPQLGESNEYVMRHILGMSEDDIEIMHSACVVDEPLNRDAS